MVGHVIFGPLDQRVPLSFPPLPDKMGELLAHRTPQLYDILYPCQLSKPLVEHILIGEGLFLPNAAPDRGPRPQSDDIDAAVPPLCRIQLRQLQRPDRAVGIRQLPHPLRVSMLYRQKDLLLTADIVLA